MVTDAQLRMSNDMIFPLESEKKSFTIVELETGMIKGNSELASGGATINRAYHDFSDMAKGILQVITAINL